MKKQKNRGTVPAKVLEETVPAMEELEKVLSRHYPEGNYSKGDCIDFAVKQTLDILKKDAVSEYSLELKSAKNALEVFLEKALKAEQLQKNRELEMNTENELLKAEIDRLKIQMHDSIKTLNDDLQAKIKLNDELARKNDKYIEQNEALAELASRQKNDGYKVKGFEQKVKALEQDLKRSYEIVENLKKELSDRDDESKRMLEERKTQFEEISVLKDECLNLRNQNKEIEIQKATLEGKMEVLNSQLHDYRNESPKQKQVSN